MSENLTHILTLIGIMAGISLVLAVILVLVNRFFHVDVDERYELILKTLPNINCGACGYPGCAGMTEGLLKGEAKPEQCKPGNEVIYAKIRAILKGENPDEVTA
ncbi:MAG TPA: (Fe-S)-binding protein [Haloplasmataceae bacterium]